MAERALKEAQEDLTQSKQDLSKQEDTLLALQKKKGAKAKAQAEEMEPLVREKRGATALLVRNAKMRKGLLDAVLKLQGGVEQLEAKERLKTTEDQLAALLYRTEIMRSEWIAASSRGFSGKRKAFHAGNTSLLVANLVFQPTGKPTSSLSS